MSAYSNTKGIRTWIETTNYFKLFCSDNELTNPWYMNKSERKPNKLFHSYDVIASSSVRNSPYTTKLQLHPAWCKCKQHVLQSLVWETVLFWATSVWQIMFPLVAKPCDKIQNWIRMELVGILTLCQELPFVPPEPPLISSSIIITAYTTSCVDIKTQWWFWNYLS